MTDQHARMRRILTQAHSSARYLNSTAWNARKRLDEVLRAMKAIPLSSAALRTAMDLEATRLQQASFELENETYRHAQELGEFAALLGAK